MAGGPQVDSRRRRAPSLSRSVEDGGPGPGQGVSTGQPGGCCSPCTAAPPAGRSTSRPWRP